MRKIIISEHVSLDGFTAGPQGEMDWIKLDDAMFDLVGTFTDKADTALYGRVTYEMMDSYWPTAGDKPKASKHDIEHSQWYNKVEKIVLSKTMKGTVKPKTTIISNDIAAQITKLKNKAGGDILIFGSPGAARTLMADNLLDEYWLFVNPIILGQGIPFFADLKMPTHLKLVSSQTFDCGVAALQFSVVR